MLTRSYATKEGGGAVQNRVTRDGFCWLLVTAVRRSLRRYLSVRAASCRLPAVHRCSRVAVSLFGESVPSVPTSHSVELSATAPRQAVTKTAGNSSAANFV